MTRRHLILAACLGGAGWLAFVADSTPQSVVVDAVTRRTPTSTTRADLRRHIPATAAPTIPAILEIVSRETLIGRDHAEIQAIGVFGSQSWTPPPPPSLPPATALKPPPPLPPPPPVAPPLPFVYLGKKLEDGKWEVYLSRGENVLIAREHSVLDDAYRTESIEPPLLSLTYLPLKKVQTIAIGGAD